MNEFAECDRFKEHVKKGKQALTDQHRPDLVEDKTARVTTSLNFESAVHGHLPKLKRWDYFIEVSRQPGVVHAVEMHNFEQTELVQKRAGTKSILRQCCDKAEPTIGSWQVVIKGAAPRADIIARFRADTGITIAGRRLVLSKLQERKNGQ